MPTSDPFPLVVPLSEYYRRAFEERKQLGPKTGNKPPDHGSTVERIPTSAFAAGLASTGLGVPQCAQG